MSHSKLPFYLLERFSDEPARLRNFLCNLFPTATQMETARLRLDPISLCHLDGFHRIWTNPDATRWA